MGLNLLLCLLSLLVLAKSAQYFVRFTSRLARSIGIPPMVIGMMVVGVATSMPEILVATLAAWHQHADLAVGSIVGSNIANIGLILGVCTLIRPMPVAKLVVRRELLVLCAVSALITILAFNGHISHFEGGGLLILLCGLLIFLCTGHHTPMAQQTTIKHNPPWRSAGLSVFSLIAILLAAEALIWSATRLATQLHVSELVIGLSVVAIGTSLPELATGVMASVAAEDDLVLGNVIGSNLFNLCAALGLPALIHPLPITHTVLTRDLPALLIATALLLLVSMPFQQRDAKIHRWEGGLLLLGYFGYIGWIALT